MAKRELTGMYEVFEAVENVIRAADPALSRRLYDVMNSYGDDFPDEYFWATGPQSPVLLHGLLFACSPAAPVTERPAVSKRSTPPSKAMH